MSDDERTALRTALACLRATRAACNRRHEWAKGRKVRRAELALLRDWRPGLDLDSRLESVRSLLGDG